MPSLAEKLAREGIVYKGKVRLKHAGESEYYLDVKKAYGNPGLLKEIAGELYKSMSEKVTCVAAGGHGGIPLATTISIEQGLKLCLVRDSLKDRGKQSLIDGYTPGKHDIIAIVDDVFTTGGSIINVYNALRETGAQVLSAHVVVKRGEGKIPVPLTYLMTAEELLKTCGGG